MNWVHGRIAIYGPTALFPQDEPPMYPVVPLDSVELPSGSGTAGVTV